MKKPTMKWTALLALPALTLVLASCSSTPTNQTAARTDNPIAIPNVDRGGIVLDAVTVTATVQSVNAADRTVALQLPDGSTNTFECGPEVRNFDQIKAGDQVTAIEASELAVALVKGGVPPVAGTATAVVRTPLGAKPGGRIVDTVAFTAKVVSVDAM